MKKICDFQNFIYLLFLAITNHNAVDGAGLCRDGKENFVEGRSDEKKNLPVVIKRLRGKLYRVNNETACFKERPTVLMPGIVRLFDGEMVVPKNHYDLVKSGTMRMSIKSPSFDNPICLNGSSQYTFMPNTFCNFNLCEFIGKELCEFLQKPGTHTIKELEQRLNFNSTLLLPEPPSLFGISLLDLLSGEFHFEFELETGGETILNLKIPTNQEFLQIGLDSEEEEGC